MHQRHGRRLDEPTEGETAWLLDDIWPEYASYVRAAARDSDQLIAPGLLGRPWSSRYRWPIGTLHRASWATARRHWTMRQVAQSPGHVRQRAYMERDSALATKLAAAIDYRARHLVVAQAWLPWLEAAGVLGGRSYDVLMSRYPFADIHRLLDRAAADYPDPHDPTISDFRAPAELVRREMALLARARRIITPHHGIAALFPLHAVTLAWHRSTRRIDHKAGTRVAFLGPMLARQRPDLACEFVEQSEAPLVVIGRGAGEDRWQSVAIEHRAFTPDWLDDIGTIVHPATMTAQPRRLLEALVNGVRIVATEACGLDPADFQLL
jgi:hypothetical protein